MDVSDLGGVPERSGRPSGARFIRADLHVHTHGDTDTDPKPDLSAYVDAAIASDIDLLAVTDHNRVRFVRDAIGAAEGKPLVILPGIEISTRQGHLLALFPPDAVDDLESFATHDNLRLTSISPTELRSDRAVIDLVKEIGARGALAIPAHVDVGSGICSHLRQSELVDLLTEPALAGLEFAKADALETWFTDGDADADRLAAWRARQGDPLLKERGLARLMSSDSHRPETVGRDRKSRTLTRLRVDDLNFAAVRNAIQLNPKARCKAEAILPAVYPRIVRAQFEGGFLDGVEMSFSENLNCLIGGRGSGKSTALLSIRAALGGSLSPDENADDPERMPVLTRVSFIDAAGSSRVAIRRRGEAPVDEHGSPLRLRIADLGQDESGRLARGHKNDPAVLLEFLDQFIVRHQFTELENSLLVDLKDGSAEILRTHGAQQEIQTLEGEQETLNATLKAATEGRIEAIATWAAVFASQKPLLGLLDKRLEDATSTVSSHLPITVDGIAAELGADLTKKPASDFVTALRSNLEAFERSRVEITQRARADLLEASKAARDTIDLWSAEQADLERRLDAKQRELKAQGLDVQAGAVRAIAARLHAVGERLVAIRKKRDAHTAACKARQPMVQRLHANREALFQARQATMKRIADAANGYADDLRIRVYFEQSCLQEGWERWLTAKYGFKRPRVTRLAQAISPAEFAKCWVENRARLLNLADSGTFFSDDDALGAPTWDEIFELETMRCEDRPRIEVQRPGSPDRQTFDQLSAGQQRSVLLSLLLCAERSEPLILDQPEDHLDGQYIASAVVRHLEAAKERRQVLIATHSANLAVLGDAELVIPMKVVEGRGTPYAVGAADRADTRTEVCALLEGGTQAYKKRGERYGFTFSK